MKLCISVHTLDLWVLQLVDEICYDSGLRNEDFQCYFAQSRRLLIG